MFLREVRNILMLSGYCIYPKYLDRLEQTVHQDESFTILSQNFKLYWVKTYTHTQKKIKDINRYTVFCVTGLAVYLDEYQSLNEKTCVTLNHF